MARVMAEEEPDRFVANMLKAKRKGKIFVDYLRNQRGATAICPFSTRARPGAYVAMPVILGEAREARQRPSGCGRRSGEIHGPHRSKIDPWPGYFKLKQPLPRLKWTLTCDGCALPQARD